MSVVMPGMLAILTPCFVAFLRASVCESDFVVGIKATSADSSASATGFGGSSPLLLKGSVIVMTVLAPSSFLVIDGTGVRDFSR